MSITRAVFSATTDTMTLMPNTPCAAMVLRSACTPAPPEQSEPAIVSTFFIEFSSFPEQLRKSGYRSCIKMPQSSSSDENCGIVISMRQLPTMVLTNRFKRLGVFPLSRSLRHPCFSVKYRPVSPCLSSICQCSLCFLVKKAVQPSYFSSFRYAASMPSAPRGAVIKIASTATDSTILPHGSPIASGTEPIAACTVAFGR